MLPPQNRREIVTSERTNRATQNPRRSRLATRRQLTKCSRIGSRRQRRITEGHKRTTMNSYPRIAHFSRHHYVGIMTAILLHQVLTEPSSGGSSRRADAHGAKQCDLASALQSAFRPNFARA